LPADVPKKVLADLKGLGYRIEGKGKERRIVLPKTQQLRKKKEREGGIRLVEKGSRSREAAEIVHIKLGPHIERQIDGVFQGLQRGDFVGFSVDGNNSYSIYGNAASLMRDLVQYQIYKDRKISSLAVFKVVNQQQYMDDGRERIAARQEAQRARRTLKARERRAMKRGLRVSRGH
jgi:hypothetical protein